jgi:hemerythrin
MWKESLCIGVEGIDEQHKALFDKTEELLKNVNSGVDNHKQECIAAILFLKDYAVKHFQDEEAYQKSIDYPEYEEHKELHESFIQTVLSHEKKMAESDFAEKHVKEFTGTLVAWLVYHVSNTDQKIGQYLRENGSSVQKKETTFFNAFRM